MAELTKKVTPTMIKERFIATYKEQTGQEITKKFAEDIMKAYNTTLEKLTDEINFYTNDKNEQKSTTVDTGFIVLSKSKKEAGTSRNPKTGETVSTQAKETPKVKFKPNVKKMLTKEL